MLMMMMMLKTQLGQALAPGALEGGRIMMLKVIMIVIIIIITIIIMILPPPFQGISLGPLFHYENYKGDTWAPTSRPIMIMIMIWAPPPP